MASTAIEMVGWSGTALVVAAYLLLTKRALKSDSSSYQLLNLIGAIGIGFNSLVNHAYPSVGINIAWSLIAVYGLAKALGK